MHPAAAFLHRARGPRSKMRPPAHPDGAILAYYGDLRPMVHYAEALTQEGLVPHLVALGAAPARADAAMPEVTRIIERLRKAWGAKVPASRIAKAAASAATATSAHNRRELFKQIKAGLGISLDDVADRHLKARIDQFTTENVALIKTVPEEYFDQIQDVALDGIAKGRRADQIASDLVERGHVAQNRARLIARDQIGKFNGDLTKTRQTDLGIEEYEWGGIDDDRERPAHVARNGHVYRWDAVLPGSDDPGIGGHPGDAIQCRCFASPRLDKILAALG